jgi:hypothetical protein
MREGRIFLFVAGEAGNLGELRRAFDEYQRMISMDNEQRR